MSVAAWMCDTITVASQTGANSSGDPTYGAQRTLRARVVDGVDAGKTENPPATTVVYCESEILVTDRLWLPGSSTSAVNDARRPMRVERARDVTGRRQLWKATL